MVGAEQSSQHLAAIGMSSLLGFFFPFSWLPTVPSIAARIILRCRLLSFLARALALLLVVISEAVLSSLKARRCASCSGAGAVPGQRWVHIGGQAAWGQVPPPQGWDTWEAAGQGDRLKRSTGGKG